MADKNSYPLSLLLRAVDGVTVPLRRVKAEITASTAPARQAANAIASIAEAGELGKLRDGFSGVLGSVRSVGREVATLARRLTVGLGVAGYASYEFIQPTIESSAALKRQAERLNLSTDELASYRFAAKEAGVQQDEFSGGLDYFNRILGQTKAGRGRLRSLLQGVTGGAGVLKELESAKGTSAALDVIVGRVNQLDDSEKRAALTGAAFGAGNRGMLNFVELGAKKIAGLRAEQQRLGGSQRGFADDAVEAARAEAELGEAWEGARRTLLTPVLPILMAQLRNLTGWFVGHRREIRAWGEDASQSIGEFADSLPGRLQAVVDFARGTKAALQPIATLVGGWPTLFATVGAGILAGPLIGSLVQLTTTVAKLGWMLYTNPIALLVLGNPATWIAAGAAVLALTIAFKALSASQDEAAAPREYSAPSRFRTAAGFWRGEERLRSSHATEFDDMAAKFGRPAPSQRRTAPTWAAGLFTPSAPILPPGFGGTAQGSTVWRMASHESDSRRLHPDDVRALVDASRGQSTVTVDFKNVPRGTQVLTKGAPGLVNLGISMAESH